ncbi:MAG: response regulator [Deltaproteobacteria bacterium]|nr:response regulator [Deltaproteobacteria bacterium]
MDSVIKVLLVDDEEKFRSTTKKLLDRRRFNTIVAESAEKAIEKLNEKPDVVLLDIKMPGMDGHEALKRIKNNSPGLPVIMLTGHGDMDSAQIALKEGAFDYLSKPCDIDILVAKLKEAYEGTHIKEEAENEKTVKDVMIPVEDYTIMNVDQTVKEAILKLRSSFSIKIATSSIMETGHRSVLVFDNHGKVRGILTIKDLLNAIMPKYLSAPKPSMADSIQYSPMFWSGMFTKEVKNILNNKIEDIMSPPPLSIDAGSNLMEAAYMMVYNKVRRLVVTKEGKAAGMIREQDLFFEIERIQKG